jgi:hypothetical protein
MFGAASFSTWEAPVGGYAPNRADYLGLLPTELPTGRGLQEGGPFSHPGSGSAQMRATVGERAVRVSQASLANGSLIPVTTCMIHESIRNLTTDDGQSDEPTTSICGQPIHLVSTVAKVQSIQSEGKGVRFSLDDGTGVLACHKYHEAGEENVVYPLGSYVHVFGTLSCVNKEIVVNAHKILPVNVPIELVHHIVSAAHTSFSLRQRMKQINMDEDGEDDAGLGGAQPGHSEMTL